MLGNSGKQDTGRNAYFKRLSAYRGKSGKLTELTAIRMGILAVAPTNRSLVLLLSGR